MATILGSLLLKLTGDTADARQAIDKVEKKAKGFSKFIKGAMGIGGAIIAFRALKNVARDLTQTYGIQETAEEKLRSAIRATRKEGSICAEKLFDYASQLQEVTTYGDEATISAMALLQQLGDLDEKGIRQLTPLLQDMASSGLMSLETAANLAGKTLGSTTNALSRYGITIDATAPKEEKIAQLTEALQKKFGGLSQDLARTKSAGLEQLNNIMGDIKEEGGKKLLETLDPMIRGMTDMLTRTLQTVNAHSLYNMALKGGISTVQEANLAMQESNSRLAEQEIALADVNRESAKNEKKISQLTEAEKTQVSNRSSSIYKLYAERTAFNLRRQEIEKNIKKEQENMTLFRDIRTSLVELQEAKAADVILTEDQTEANEDGAEALGVLSDAYKNAAAGRAAYNTVSFVSRLTEADMWAAHQAVLEALEQMPGKYDEVSEKIQEYTDAATTVLSGVGDVFSQFYTNRSIELENDYEKRKQAIEDNIGDEEERAEALEGLDKEFDQKRKELKTKQARADKAQGILTATIDTFVAANKALSQGGIFGGPAFAALMIILGMAKVAAISAQKIPKFAKGADYITQGPEIIQVGEAGPEHVQITPRDQVERQQIGGSISGDVYLDGEKVGRWIEQKVRNQEILQEIS